MSSSRMPRAARALLAVVLTALVTVIGLGLPAHAADGPTLKSTPSSPTNREPVTISGRFPDAPTGRTVVLEKTAGLFGGEWEQVAATTTGGGGRFSVTFTSIDSDRTYRAVLRTKGGKVAETSEPLELEVRYASVDLRWERGDASGNRSSLLACFGDESSACESDDDAHMTPAWLAFVLVVCFLAVAVLLLYACADLPGPLAPAAMAGGEIAWILVFHNLAFGYALPRIGLELNALYGVVLYPLYLIVLLLGLVVMIGYPALVVRLLHARAMPDDRTTRSMIFAGVLGLLWVWRKIHLNSPEIAAGPFSVKTDWLNDALHTWTLEWPVTVLWTVLEFFATTDGIALFAALAALSLVLPAPGRDASSNPVLALTQGTIANVAALLVGTAALAVVSIIAFAVLVLALVALMAYVLFYIAVAVMTAAMISWLVRS